MTRTQKQRVTLIVAADDLSAANNALLRAGFGPENFSTGSGPQSFTTGRPTRETATHYDATLQLSANELTDLQRRFTAAGITVESETLSSRDPRVSETERLHKLRDRNVAPVDSTTERLINRGRET